MSYQWRVGEKAVCISDTWKTHCGETAPLKGTVYTIENIEICPFSGEIGFQLLELINTPRRYLGGLAECNFRSTGFRPLTKTNIEIFEKLLLPAPKQRVRTDA